MTAWDAQPQMPRTRQVRYAGADDIKAADVPL